MIRLEEKKDYQKVENLIRESFWNVYEKGCSEHYIMHNIRKTDNYIKKLSYLIEENGEIIAHIAYVKGNIYLNNGTEEEILIIGPISVLPKYQNLGYGSKLMKYTLDIVKKMNYPLIVLTGDPKYYSRFGFETASNYEIFHKELNKKEDLPYFMVKVLDDEKIKNIKGIYVDPDCYIVNKKEVEKFDLNFPKKD